MVVRVWALQQGPRVHRQSVGVDVASMLQAKVCAEEWRCIFAKRARCDALVVCSNSALQLPRTMSELCSWLV